MICPSRFSVILESYCCSFARINASAAKKKYFDFCEFFEYALILTDMKEPIAGKISRRPELEIYLDGHQIRIRCRKGTILKENYSKTFPELRIILTNRQGCAVRDKVKLPPIRKSINKREIIIEEVSFYFYYKPV